MEMVWSYVDRQAVYIDIHAAHETSLGFSVYALVVDHGICGVS